MADRENSITDDIHIRGLDVKNRRIYFGIMDDSSDGDFTWHSVEQVIRNMHILLAIDSSKPIELHINSVGGDIISMIRLIDEILSCPCQVVFIGGGTISSAGAFLMCVCDERVLHKNTEIMLHHGSQNVEGNVIDTMITFDRYTQMTEFGVDLLTNNSRMPFDFWKTVLQRDVFLSASEAVSLGIADRIIEPRKRGNLRRARIAKMNDIPSRKALSEIVDRVYTRIYKTDVHRIEISIPKEEFDKEQETKVEENIPKS